MCLECMMDVSFIPVTNITNEYLTREIAIWRKKIVFLEKKLNKQNYNQYLKYLNYWNFPIANFFAGKYVLSLRTADAFPVVASLPPLSFRRERKDDRKCVCCSQASTYLFETTSSPGLFPQKWVGREKALASAGHVYSLNIPEKLIYMQPAGFTLTEVEESNNGK